MKRLLLILFIPLLLLNACTGDQSEMPVKPQPRPLAKPFRFQRTLEIKPGLIYDVFTWGRGKDSTSAYLILRSDSTHQQFKAITAGELSGKPSDAWDMDMDTDGNPEIVLQVALSAQINDLYIYEFDRSGNAAVIRFPSLSEKAKKGFKGQDKIYVREGQIRRDFLYQDPDDKQAKPLKRALIYKMNGSSFIVQEITKQKQ